MKYLKLNPETGGGGVQYYLDSKKVVSTSNKHLIGYYFTGYNYSQCYIPVDKVPGPGLYLVKKFNDEGILLETEDEFEFIKMDIETGEDCSDAVINLIKDANPDMTEELYLTAWTCNVVVEDLKGKEYTYTSLVREVYKDYGYDDMTGDEKEFFTSPLYYLLGETADDYLSLIFIDEGEDSKVYACDYELSDGTVVKIKDVCGSNLTYEDNNYHNLTTLNIPKYFTIEGQPTLYYSNLLGEYSWEKTNDGFISKYDNIHGTYTPGISYLYIGNPNDGYDYYPCLSYTEGLTETKTVINSEGQQEEVEINKIALLNGDENQFYLVLTAVGPRTNGYVTAYTGNTIDNLSFLSDKIWTNYYKNYFKEPEEIPGVQDIKINMDATPGVSYFTNSGNTEIYYNQPGPILYFALDNEPIWCFKDKTVVFNSVFNRQIDYRCDMVCGGFELPVGSVEKLEVTTSDWSWVNGNLVYHESDFVDITDKFNNGEFSMFNLYLRSVYNKVDRSYDTYSTIKLTFTDKFMRDGSMFGMTEECRY